MLFHYVKVPNGSEENAQTKYNVKLRGTEYTAYEKGYAWAIRIRSDLNRLPVTFIGLAFWKVETSAADGLANTLWRAAHSLSKSEHANFQKEKGVGD